MLADLLDAIWPALPWLFAAGGCFILAGAIWWAAIARHNATLDATADDRDIVLGEYAVRPYIPPAPIVPAQTVEPNYHRPDADTHVIPGIPGATPPLSPQLRAVARYLDGRAADETVEIVTAWEAAEPVEGLRVIPSTGPVCPICGAPFHAVCPSAPKSSEQTQVVDLCPLTTQDIEVPTYGHTPVHRAIADREPTREMSGTVARALEAAP